MQQPPPTRLIVATFLVATAVFFLERLVFSRGATERFVAAASNQRI